MSQKKSVKNHTHPVDLTSLYAYTDSSHFRDRELWRGFLGCVLPLMFAEQVENIDQMITESVVGSLEELSTPGEYTGCSKKAIHHISAHIAESIGVSKEFALASFYDNESIGLNSTKLYKFNHVPVKEHLKSVQEDNMINQWLTRFNEVCTDKKFLYHVETWKDWLS